MIQVFVGQKLKLKSGSRAILIGLSLSGLDPQWSGSKYGLVSALKPNWNRARFVMSLSVFFWRKRFWLQQQQQQQQQKREFSLGHFSHNVVTLYHFRQLWRFRSKITFPSTGQHLIWYEEKVTAGAYWLATPAIYYKGTTLNINLRPLLPELPRYDKEHR